MISTCTESVVVGAGAGAAAVVWVELILVLALVLMWVLLVRVPALMMVAVPMLSVVCDDHTANYRAMHSLALAARNWNICCFHCPPTLVLHTQAFCDTAK